MKTILHARNKSLRLYDQKTLREAVNAHPALWADVRQRNTLQPDFKAGKVEIYVNPDLRKLSRAVEAAREEKHEASRAGRFRRLHELRCEARRLRFERDDAQYQAAEAYYTLWHELHPDHVGEPPQRDLI